MASKDITGVQYSCDACDTVKLVGDGERPDGYHGMVTVVRDGKFYGIELDWWACKIGCIRKAITNVAGRERIDAEGTPQEEGGRA